MTATRLSGRVLRCAAAVALLTGAASVAVDAAPAAAGRRAPARSASAPSPAPPSSAPVAVPGFGPRDALPAPVLAALRGSGVPLKNFGVFVQSVDLNTPPAIAALNAEQPFLLASTTKLITTLSALALLGPERRWQTKAYITAPLVARGIAGDLVLVGGDVGLSPDELRRWFKSMRGAGLSHVGGRIVLERLSLLQEQDAVQSPAAVAESAPEAPTQPPRPRDTAGYNDDALVVSVQPGPGNRATVSLRPRARAIDIVNDVAMDTERSGCNAWASWRNAPGNRGGPQLWVRGRWDASCGAQDVAFIRLPAAPRATAAAGRGSPAASDALVSAAAAGRATPVLRSRPVAARMAMSTESLVAMLWAEVGGSVAGGVIDAADLGATPPGGPPGARARVTPRQPQRRPFSETTSALSALVNDINKTSNNVAARELLLALGDGMPGAGAEALRRAQVRVHEWLRTQGIADGDLRVAIGSGQSRDERGTPRAMVQLLTKAWRSASSELFLRSLPVAGVDGTLANRMKRGPAAGAAFLKTGTLHDTRALAGYVLARSGRVYAVALLVNHDAAARATPALDATVEWIAGNG